MHTPPNIQRVPIIHKTPSHYKTPRRKLTTTTRRPNEKQQSHENKSERTPKNESLFGVTSGSGGAILTKESRERRPSETMAGENRITRDLFVQTTDTQSIGRIVFEKGANSTAGLTEVRKRAGRFGGKYNGIWYGLSNGR